MIIIQGDVSEKGVYVARHHTNQRASINGEGSHEWQVLSGRSENRRSLTSGNGLIVILMQVRAKEKDSAGDTQRLGIRAERAHWMGQALWAAAWRFEAVGCMPRRGYDFLLELD